jgi:two-component system NtrC family sensor kinase
MTVHLHADPDQGQAALTALADSLDACSVAVDTAGRIVGVTGAWRAFAGRNPFLAGQELGSSYADLCRQLARSPDGNLSIVALGLTSVLEGRVPRLVFDFPFDEADGPHQYGCTALLRTSEDGIRAVIHIHDITQRSAMERRMRRSERLFKATTDNAMDFICLLDPGSQMVYHNPALKRFLGQTEPWSADQKMVDLVHADDRDAFLTSLKLGAKAGLTQVFEYRLPDAQGRWTEVEGQASAVEDPGGAGDSVLLISRDISLRKQMERDRASAEIQVRHSQKLEAIGQLAAGIAHEINTPTQYIGDNTTFLRDAFAQSTALLRTLQGHLERIRDGSGPDAAEAQLALAALEAGDVDYLEEEIPRAIQQTLEGVARVSKIVGAMKDFSHPGEAAATIDLHRAIESTITVSRGEWKTVADLDTEFAPDLPLVSCYPGEINQVILNLVVNAAHAIAARQELAGSTTPGRIRIGTRLLPGEVEIWVADDGTGISTEIRDRIFDPFFTTKVVGKGSGQGLSIVHAVITEKHKGRIAVDSAPGQGTTFRIFLPLVAGNH